MAEAALVAVPTLRLREAVKRYGDTVALDGLTFDVAPGEWLGLLGPNGAGKTTAMLAAAGLVQLDRGRVEVLGEVTDGPRPTAVGLVPQEIRRPGSPVRP